MMAMEKVGKWTFYHWMKKPGSFYPPQKIPDVHEDDDYLDH
jgi:hypothetical protein